MAEAESPPQEDERDGDPEGVLRFPCSSCGALLTFQPGTTSLKCAWCGHENPIEGGDVAIEEQDFEAWLERLAAEAPKEEQARVRCEGCGAEVERPEHLESFSCPYCASSLATGATVRRAIRPAALLPFALDATRARVAFRSWLAGLWFAPSRLRRDARRDGRLRGVYLPYWTWDADSTTPYAGQRGDDYWVTQTYTVRAPGGGTSLRTRQVRRTRWRSARGVVRVGFDDVLVPATHALPAPTLNELEPWDLDRLEPYAEGFLAGFETELYQVELAEGFDLARTRMEERIREAIRRDIGGDHQRITSMHPRYEAIRFKHVLLPVWIAAYRFRGKLYRFTVNARTGEVHGERPWSVWKIALAVLAGLLAAGAIYLIAR